MNSNASIALSLAALGHETRLAIFRLLVRAGDEGLNVGEIGQHIDMAASTLAHHLKALVDAGLVIQERQGRQILNRVDYGAMRRTVSFLTAECCVGVTLTQEDVA
ncbi:metalloregulator ArsR/SmtB family transcription factor [Sulfitobacter sp. HNIBRBA3233]|uniref:ArsR/SmtB family transcription factor n=1 Tax=Sulfitobacter marinivivus TaxID=3158558 RepID=UPI0032E0425D